MASQPPKNCCFTGSLHEGDPTGEIKQIDTFRAYIASPKGNEKPDKAVILLSDIFGIFPNNQLVADGFARHGYLVVLPDLFNGDQVKVGDYDAKKIDIGSWISRHTVDDVAPVVEAAMTYLRADLGVKSVAAAGYCFGAKYVVRYLKEGAIDSGYIAHPSLVTNDELGAIQRPLAISAAEHDTIFTTAKRHASEEILIGTGQGFQINLFSGVSHGFASRGDLSQPHVLFAKGQAFAQAVAWFEHTLQI
ncbi:dienelactone hydrolase family protein [Aspergillus cavernicola]|uniref:Dienelactone hydrolase family protein n=1 Tax=Aspergillus cavernicola TaxID=176166 RepID=A0ABR4IES7_9EURO